MFACRAVYSRKSSHAFGWKQKHKWREQMKQLFEPPLLKECDPQAQWARRSLSSQSRFASQLHHGGVAVPAAQVVAVLSSHPAAQSPAHVSETPSLCTATQQMTTG